MVKDMSVSLRFAELLHATSLGVGELAKRIGVTPLMIKHLLEGRNYPSHDTYVRLKKVFPNLNFYWLIFGVGSMWIYDLEPEKQQGSTQTTPQKEPTRPIKDEEAESSLFRGNNDIKTNVLESNSLLRSGNTPPSMPKEKSDAVTTEPSVKSQELLQRSMIEEAEKSLDTASAVFEVKSEEGGAGVTNIETNVVDNTSLPSVTRIENERPPLESPSSVPDLIVLQPDGRYIRYRAVKEE
jgi:hypothetical protein